MTDQELIDLVQQKAPEELSLEELDALSQGLRTSAPLRDALLDRLHMEQYLGEALGRIELSVDRIISRAEQTPRSTPWAWMLGWSVATSLLLIVGFVAYRTWWMPRQEVAKVDANPLEPNTEQPIENGKVEAVDDRPPSNQGQTSVAENNPSEATSNPPAGEFPADTDPQPWRVQIEAEKFARGNLEVDTIRGGKGIGVLVVRRERKERDLNPFVEYDVEVPVAGVYQIELRYAADASAPLRMSVNGRVVKEDAAAVASKNRSAQSQRWYVEGAFPFLAGKNVLRLEAEGKDLPRGKLVPFPSLDQLAIRSISAASDGSPLPRPWDEVAQVTEPAPPFAEVCFGDFTPEQIMRSSDLRRWVDQVPGQPFKVQENGTSPPIFEGLARLLAPWKDDLALRLALYDHHGFKLHLWTGQEGVTLWHYAYPPTWAAYKTTRVAAEPKPATFALAANDNQMFGRLGAGTLELRHVEGQLVMTRGNVRLLTVPLSAPPQEVYFEGRATVRGITLVRSEGLPAEPTPRPTILRADKPGHLAWTENLPAGAKLNKLEDGAIELTATKTKAPAWSGIALQEPGLYEAIFEIENPQPGAGVFLGDASGPQHQLNFFRDSRTSWTSFAFLAPGDNRTESNHDIAQHPVPYALPRQWIRLVLGFGSLKCWTSGDGLHWSRALTPLQNPLGFSSYTHVGLCCVQGDQPRLDPLAQTGDSRAPRHHVARARRVERQGPGLARRSELGPQPMARHGAGEPARGRRPGSLAAGLRGPLAGGGTIDVVGNSADVCPAGRCAGGAVSIGGPFATPGRFRGARSDLGRKRRTSECRAVGSPLRAIGSAAFARRGAETLYRRDPGAAYNSDTQRCTFARGARVAGATRTIGTLRTGPMGAGHRVVRTAEVLEPFASSRPQVSGVARALAVVRAMGRRHGPAASSWSPQRCHTAGRLEAPAGRIAQQGRLQHPGGVQCRVGGRAI